MHSYSLKLGTAVVALVIVTTVGRADAVPAFARKYQTSCQTCHTVFPKLNPFGEAFRRNNFRFPGVDSDFVKAEPVALGTDAQKQLFPNAVWPASVSPFPAFAIGIDGTATIHPDTSSSAGVADNGAVFNTDNLIAEAHIWAAGAVDDVITYYVESTFSGGGVDVERGAIYFSDLVGPKHAVNLVVGRGPSSVTSFGPHSSYINDTEITAVGVTGLFGAGTDPFQFTDNHTGVELNGVIGGRIDYAAGVVAGNNLDSRNSGNVYAHVGYKVGGATLDGEGSGATDIEHEHAITLDAFGYRWVTHFADVNMATVRDVTTVGGAAIRAQWEELELNSGVFYENDDQTILNGLAIHTVTQFDEASWRIYPWLVLAGRVDFVQVTPDGGAAVNDVVLTPGVIALVRPNIRCSVTLPIERASGAPPAGWGAAGFAAAPVTATSSIGPEVEAIQLNLFAAF